MLQFYTRITEKGKIGLLRDCPWDYLEEVMKKVLVSLLVLALAMTSAFAAVDFTGEVVAGYVFQLYNDEWNFATMGEDGTGSAPIKLNASVADENGYWNVTLKGDLVADSRLGGNANVDLGKIIMGADSDVSIKLGMYAMDRVTGYRAYANQSGLNLDRVRTDKEGLWFNLDVAYGDLVAVQVAGGPSLSSMIPGMDKPNGETADYTAGADLLVSAIVRPINGLAISAAYALGGDNSIPFAAGTDGYVNGAVNVDLGAILGTDWTLGISAADKYAIGDNTNLFLASVYGGIDVFQLAVEYGLINGFDKNLTATSSNEMVNMLYVGADINVLEGLLLNAYFGSVDLVSFDTSWYLGANIGYEVYDGITLQVNLQYAADDAPGVIGGDISEGSVKAAGFSITPKMSIAF